MESSVERRWFCGVTASEKTGVVLWTREASSTSESCSSSENTDDDEGDDDVNEKKKKKKKSGEESKQTRAGLFFCTALAPASGRIRVGL